MAALIALAAICLFAAGAPRQGSPAWWPSPSAGRTETSTLTSQAPGTVTRAGRRLTGLHVRAPDRTATGDREKTLV